MNVVDLKFFLQTSVDHSATLGITALSFHERLILFNLTPIVALDSIKQQPAQDGALEEARAVIGSYQETYELYSEIVRMVHACLQSPQYPLTMDTLKTQVKDSNTRDNGTRDNYPETQDRPSGRGEPPDHMLSRHLSNGNPTTHASSMASNIQQRVFFSHTNMLISIHTSQKIHRLPEVTWKDLITLVNGEQRYCANTFHLKLEKLRWRIDVTISSRYDIYGMDQRSSSSILVSVLSRVLEPCLLLEMTLSNGRKEVFEVSLAKFHQVRYHVTSLLNEMENIEKRKLNYAHLNFTNPNARLFVQHHLRDSASGILKLFEIVLSWPQQVQNSRFQLYDVKDLPLYYDGEGEGLVAWHLWLLSKKLQRS
uniref:COMM domain-containing protein 5 n=1 Tax=Timema douglasi TaxID=61478 RepID=A0A7R8VKG5_TIMDO|nr:unnamed protein product [Timema douglasi]